MTTSRERVARHRARQRAGMVVLRVTVDMDAVVGLLLDGGFLAVGADPDDRDTVIRALEAAISVWSRA